MLACSAACAWAQGGEPAAPVQVDLSTTALPRFDAEPTPGGPRVEMALLQAQQGSLGPALGLNPAAGQGPQLTPGSVDLGLRYRWQLGGDQRIDLTAWRRMAAPDDAISLVQQRQPTYGARVEMKFAPARAAGFAADVNFIGMQLESGARITVKRKDGRPMVYYRAKF